MRGSDARVPSAREALTPFGELRPQLPSDWKGPFELHPSLLHFYEEVGPYGEDGPQGPDGVIVPTLGNPFQIVPLTGLWDMQAGYRWDGGSGERLADWRDEWLVVADQGGDPFILDRTSGSILHAHHGEGAWEPEPIFADVFVMALVLGTIGSVHEEAGEEVYDENFEVRPAWRTALRARLTPILGSAEGDAIASHFGW